MSRKARTEAMLLRLTPEDKDAITKAAAKADMSREEYIRAAVLAYMAMTFNSHALRAALRGGVELLKELEEEGRQQFFSKKVKA
jgi:uncharacterized protein (DUF1778 family)